MSHTAISQEIRSKLDNPGFPDFQFFVQDAVLDASLDTLRTLLAEEKKDFETLIKKPIEQITFDDLEDDSLLDYFWAILNHLESVSSSEKTRQIINTFMPEMQDLGNEIAYSKAYFDRIKYLFENADLDSDQKRVLELSLQGFRDRGIDLPEDQQNRVKDLNKKLAQLSEKFTHNIVDEEKTFSYTVENFDDVKELPEDILKKYEKDGKWIFDADPTAYQAIMKYAPGRQLRKDFETAKSRVCSSGNYDNRQNVLDILKYCQEKAKILGYKTAAHMSLQPKMANSPEEVIDLMSGISQKAKIKVKSEFEEIKEYFDLDTLESYDVPYYARKLQNEKYALDEQELKKYFELENSLDYMLGFIEKFYDVAFKKIDIKSYHDDVRVYGVYRDDKLIAYYFMDLFYREGKRPWAWANNLRSKFIPPKTTNAKSSSKWQKVEKIPVVLNVCNFMKNEDGKTTLYKRDVETIFHEFGHALHEMLSQSKYSSLSGFGVEWDFVELPSQLLENWVKDTSSLKKLSGHVETGKSIPDTMIETIEKLKTFMGGNFVVRQNEFALMDMNLYSGEVPNDVEALDAKILDLVNMYSIWHREKWYSQYTSFGHIFGGGYAAGYYSYMWAEILEADVFARIKEMGMFDPKTGKKLFDTLIGQGARKPAEELFEDFMGRKVDDTAFMKRHGLI